MREERNVNFAVEHSGESVSALRAVIRWNFLPFSVLFFAYSIPYFPARFLPLLLLLLLSFSCFLLTSSLPARARFLANSSRSTYTRNARYE